MNVSRALFLSVAVLLFSAFASAPESKGVGDKVPDFTLSAYGDSAPVTLSELNREAPVLLVFWTTWCPNCHSVMLELNKLHEEKNSQGFKILAVNVEENPKEVESFIRQESINFPVVFDEDGMVANGFGLVGVPTVMFLEKGGRVLYYGYRLPKNVDSLLEPGRS